MAIMIVKRDDLGVIRTVEGDEVKDVKLWAVRKGTDGKVTVDDVEPIENTETEELFESLLVESPNLLMENLTLIGRQVPTGGGPLDLIGVDQDGRLVIFELKRGSLTRESVAQLLDYTSDIASMDADHFAELIEDSSGKNGIDKIDDFIDWYSQSYPNSDSILEEKPRMMLVGLSADSRAVRIVEYLAKAGIDISLLTFNAFKQNDTTFLARQVEVLATSRLGRESGASPTKAGNLQALEINATQLGVKDLLDEIADFAEKEIPGYRWPSKYNYAFSLNEYTDAGKPSLRVYLRVEIVPAKSGTVLLVFQQRAKEAAGSSMDVLKKALSNKWSENQYGQVKFSVQKSNWPNISEAFATVLRAMVEGWKRKMTEEDSSDNT